MSYSSEIKNRRNRLAVEKSPYLLQHADNPVDWFPWGEEAFEKAVKEDKPIFLSIGYSTCHWCHVMEHESFEDPEVAKLMNEVFVSIKVDREERPDIDNIYMTVCQMMTGSGGWPLTIIMTPDKVPFFAATYIPKDNRFGRFGMMDIIPKINELWTTQREKVNSTSGDVEKALKKFALSTPGEELGKEDLTLAYKHLSQRYDPGNGGFGSSPKFPSPHNLLFLLNYWSKTKDKEALEMVEKTLKSMRKGGIFDHIGLGFHRYSTDSRWLVPHFEKMLYDQATLAMAYTAAYQATGKEEYMRTVDEIFTYIMRDMTDKGGGFYSAEDADSEGEEGKFYLWTLDEIGEIRDSEDISLVIDMFNIKKEGNYFDEATREKNGGNILHMTKEVSDMARELKVTEKELLNRVEKVRKKLFDIRGKRIHPGKDDKILTDWNGLMIAAFARAATAFSNPAYYDAAKNGADFILSNMRDKDGRLLHMYRSGQAAIKGNLDDYAFFIWALIELYEAGFDVQYLKTALELNHHMVTHFWDHKSGGLFFTADDSEKLPMRLKDIYDGAVPSGNSVAMLNLLKLGRMTSDPKMEEMSAKIGKEFSKQVKQSPSAYTFLMLAVDFTIGPSYEVVIAGKRKDRGTREMREALGVHFLPNKVVLLNPADEKNPEILKLAGFLKYQTSLKNKATAYVCLDYACQAPTTDKSKMVDMLKPAYLHDF